MGLLDNLAYDPQMALGMGLLEAGGNSRMPMSLGQGLAHGFGQMQGTAQMAQRAKLMEQEALLKQQQMEQARMQMEQLKQAQQEHEQMQAAARASFQSPAQQALAMGGQGPTNQAAAMIPNLQPKFDTQSFLSEFAKVNPLAALKMQQSMKKDPIKLGAEETLLNPETYKPIATGMGKTPAPSEVSKLIAERDKLPPNHPARSIYDNAISKATTHQPATSVTVQPDKDPFKNISKLREEFNSQPAAKAFAEVESAYKQINYALSNPSASNDLAAATKIMKMLDPGSVVRESELGMAMAATGKLDQFSNYANMLQTGQKLTPSQRADFKQTAQGLYAAAKSSYNAKAKEYRDFATTYNLNPDHVVKLSPETPNAGGAPIRKYNPATGKIE